MAEARKTKEIDDLILLVDLSYSKEHTWAKSEGENIRVGISDYAQNQLGELIYIELPQQGDTFGKDEVFGIVESVKTTAELYTPIGGQIVSVNSDLEDSPEVVNSKPYDDGWMIEIKPDDQSELDDLLSREDYIKMLKGT
jgi:glycine cleavage system H protein